MKRETLAQPRLSQVWTASLVLLIGTVSLSCGSDPTIAHEDDIETSLEIFSWWTNAGEADALSQLLSAFTEEYSEVIVTNAATTDPTNARERLSRRLKSGEPPDTFQAISGVDLLTWVAQGRMQSLNELAQEEGWNDVFPRALLDVLSQDGKIYGVPANIERDNNLYYNVSLFNEHSLEPPETLEEFFTSCDTLRAASVTPLAVPAAGWVLALVAFETLMPAVLGGRFYMDFFSGNAEVSGPELTNLFTEMKKVLECSNVSRAEPSWTVGADLLYEGQAAMYVMGDWAKGYLEGGEDSAGVSRDRWVPIKDFDVVPGLGSRGYFTFNSAVFGLPKGAQHPKAAGALLRFIGSRAGQEVFNPIKGSVPARSGLDLSLFDEMVHEAAQDFQEAAIGDKKLLPGYASLTTFDYQKEVNPSLLVFAVGGQRARELDPENVSESEALLAPLNVEYIVGKLSVTYPILQNE